MAGIDRRAEKVSEPASGSRNSRMEKKIRGWVRTWEGRCYPEGIPDEAPSELENANLVPSYRRICKAILKNDFPLLTLGFTREPCEAYSLLKKIEINERLRRDKRAPEDNI